MAYEPVLTSHINEPHSYTLDFYTKNQRGYEGLRKALAQKPNDIIEQVKASGLRGRGGAGFPTGMKWQFVLKDTPKPKYIACNADESEPGTFKDHVLMERNPHLLIEGCAIACYAIGAKVAYIYIRGEFYHVQEILEADGCEVETAQDGEEGLARLAQRDFDLVLSDVVMPNMDGHELYTTVRARYPGLPVLMMTAFHYDKDHIIKRSRLEGLEGVVFKKPVA